MSSKYALSVEMAKEELMKADPAQTAIWAGASYDDETKLLRLKLCNRPVVFDFGRGELNWGDSDEPFDSVAAIPVLHYLVKARGAEPTGELLPYRDLWGAKVQSVTLLNRPATGLAKKYAADPGRVLRAAGDIGGQVIEKYGDARLDILVLPKVPLALMLYAADDDIPAGAKFLFDSVIKEYLPTEDIIWVAEMLAEVLTRA